MKIGMMVDIYKTQVSRLTNLIALCRLWVEKEQAEKARQHHVSPLYKLTRFFDRFQ